MSKPPTPTLVTLRRKLNKKQDRLRKLAIVINPTIWETLSMRFLRLEIAQINSQIQAEIMRLS